MKFSPTAIADVVILEPRIFNDERGYFTVTYEAGIWEKNLGFTPTFVQDNHSHSHQGVLRGLHYQIRHGQGKLVSVMAGEIFDVAVDLRQSSPTFGQWVGEILSGDNHRSLWIPPGFAHGFLVLSPTADVVYKVSDRYAPEYERTLRWDDPTVGIQWPSHGDNPVLSPKDQQGQGWQELEFFT